MATADHLVVSHGLYTHHGIDLGDGTVVQYSKETLAIQRVDFARFSDGREVWVREYVECGTHVEVMDRASQRVGEASYHLVFNNCEHFATWCKTGRRESSQVKAVERRLGAISAKVTAKSTVRALAKGGTRLAWKVIARGATPWLLAADAAQLGTELAAANLGAAPHAAEKAGRGVGLVGSVAIGAATAGPVGAGVGLGLWVVGEVAGRRFDFSGALTKSLGCRVS